MQLLNYMMQQSIYSLCDSEKVFHRGETKRRSKQSARILTPEYIKAIREGKTVNPSIAIGQSNKKGK